MKNAFIQIIKIHDNTSSTRQAEIKDEVQINKAAYSIVTTTDKTHPTTKTDYDALFCPSNIFPVFDNAADSR